MVFAKMFGSTALSRPGPTGTNDLAVGRKARKRFFAFKGGR